MRNKITVSAPGKLVLFGEHAVVYGRPSIVTAMGQRMKVTVELTDEPIFELNAPDVNILDYKKPMSDLGQGDIPKGAKFIEIALYNFYNIYNRYTKSAGIKITTKSEFSAQYGFGSSSAAAVCVIFALSKILKKNLSQRGVFDLACKTVLDIQGKGSGVDVAAAVYGGTLYFVTGGKIIKPLKTDSIPLMVGYSGIKTDTVTLLGEVKQKAGKYPQVVEDIYDSIARLVEQAKKAILGKDWSAVGELMNFNEGYLSALGVEGERLSSMIYAARSTGAYGAKLSGAGIGDCMIALHSVQSKLPIKKAIEKAGGQVIDVKANVEGVKIDG